MSYELFWFLVKAWMENSPDVRGSFCFTLLKKGCERQIEEWSKNSPAREKKVVSRVKKNSPDLTWRVCEMATGMATTGKKQFVSYFLRIFHWNVNIEGRCLLWQSIWVLRNWRRYWTCYLWWNVFKASTDVTTCFDVDILFEESKEMPTPSSHFFWL